MKLILKEYNVVPNVEDRNELNILLFKNKIIYNNKEIIDNNKINLINKMISEYKKIIIELNKEKIQNYKGGRQKSLMIKFNFGIKFYKIIGNTSSKESSNLYDTIKNKLIDIIEK